MQSGRIIPACAGKTVLRVQAPIQVSDHPRVRGENGTKKTGMTRPDGSSPRARGKLIDECLTKEECRIIPACAGKTQGRRGLAKYIADHPRVRGENVSGLETKKKVVGSSPRARGKRLWLTKARQAVRIIPACAGKTPFEFGAALAVSDHPRVRGENA